MEPVIKVRHKALTFLFAWAFLSSTSDAGISICNKIPKGQTAEKAEGDNGFSLSLNGSPKLYRPHQTYTITLTGWRDEQLVKFQDFILVAEPAPGSTIMDPDALGTFQLMPGDAMSKFSHLCSHAVGATSSISKKKIEIYWTAPGRHSGCISFKAMVVERPDVWYMDDDALTYTVCEDSSTLAEPQDVNPCCACDEAKYEVIFEGIWSRHTHPKDFPEDEWRTQFSTLIGASHSDNYSLWDYGEQATPALQALGERGRTRPLEAQMKRYSQSIRSVIKAHGLQQRSNVEGQTFAVFRVDRNHHLLSVVSKMIPSPDFIVGVSKENLCLENCSWVPYRAVDLYPWDIGTDRGVQYDSPPDPQRPRGIIQRITSNNPDNPASPFFDESGAPMKPAARLHIIRQRIYKKNINCPLEEGKFSIPNPMNPSWVNSVLDEGGYGNDQGVEDSDDYADMDNYGRESNSRYDEGETDYSYPSRHHDSYNTESEGIKLEDPEEEEEQDSYSFYDRNNENHEPEDESTLDSEFYPGHPCHRTQWEEWSDCSHSCDYGSRSRRREFSDETAAEVNNCQQETFEKETCKDLPKCKPVRYGGNFNLFESQDQVKSSWGNSEKVSYDTVDAPDNSYLYDGRGEDPYDYRDNSYTYASRQRSYEYPQPAKLQGDSLYSEKNCQVTEYGPWSDCSSSCGKGTQTRTRRYREPEKSFECSEDLDDVRVCGGVSPECSSYAEGEGEEDSGHRERESNNYYERNRFQERDPRCKTSEWSTWSPCSKKCDLGYKLRTRLYLWPFVPNRVCDKKLIDKADCYGSGPECPRTSYSENDNSRSSLYFLSEVENQLGPKDNDIGIVREHEEEDFCQLDPDPGPCRGYYNRWHYSPADNSCQKFIFHGCEGNKNNFASEEVCLETCRTRSTKDWKNSRRKDAFSQLKSMSFIKLPMDEPAKPRTTTKVPMVDCRASNWTGWSRCSASCGGVGWQTRYREILVQPKNGGRSCPKKLVRRRKCANPTPCTPPDHSMWYQGSWRLLAGS